MILKNNAPFVSCITRINGELIEDTDDLDVVMPMYNLLEDTKNYIKTIGSFTIIRDELTNDNIPAKMFLITLEKLIQILLNIKIK